MTCRVMFYVQHLLGVGHVARAAAIARAMVAEGLDVRVVLGGEPVSQISFGSIETVQLAPIRALDMHFTALVDIDGNVIDDAFQERRREALLFAYKDFRPDVLLVEHFPFGRRQLSF